jgi:cytoskeletal protein RodZ
MDDKKEPGEAAAPTPDNERVGEIIRRERERRNASLPVIAKDLRLSPKFIEALEANDYDLLPGDTYIRVYLRSLCKYFSLNADEILERFFKERGLSGVDTLRKDSSTKIHLATLKEKDKPNKTIILAITVVVVLALLSFIAIRLGWFSPETPTILTKKIDSISLRTERHDTLLAQKTHDTLSTDSLSEIGSGTTIPADTSDTKKLPDLSTVSKSAVIKDSIIKAEELNKRIKDSIATVEARNRSIKDSIRQFNARVLFIKDSIRQAEERSKSIRDSIIKAEARDKIIRDSLVKVAVRNKFVKDSISKVADRNKAIKDSVLKAEVRNKAVKDSLRSAASKNKAAKDSISNVELKKKAIMDSVNKALAKNKSVKDSVLKNGPKNTMVKDSLVKTVVKNTTAKDSVKTKPGPVAAKTTPGNNQPMELKLEVTGAAAWARVLSDGTPWRNILNKGAVRIFTAQDSFNLRSGMLEDLTFTLNGKKLDLPAQGVTVLKIDRSGTTVWTDELWSKVTKGRF